MNEQAIFAAAMVLSGDARAAFLEAACGGDEALGKAVEALLVAQGGLGGEAPAGGDRVAATTAALSPQPQAGTLVAGRYKLIELMGEGGMGAVWRAEQKEPVKLIKPGMDSRAVLARFEAERQALAVMDHPHIAKVFDGGMTGEGRPFFVMELVQGISLTDYCDQVRCPLRERLTLFRQVCSAVQHAHQEGIIHRDLRPSNILVAEQDGRPVAKVIDFGLAKALHGAHALTDVSMHTAIGAVVGTPLYMAPE
jgi:serine/threonine protein kinase